MNDPWSFAKCSEETFKYYLNKLSYQNKWDEILEISRGIVNELDIEFKRFQVSTFNAIDTVCVKSPMIGVPGYSGLKC